MAHSSLEQSCFVSTRSQPVPQHMLSQVGVRKARALARQHSVPFVPVHHMEAHALTARQARGVHFPYLTLLVSGGHTMLLTVHGVGDYTLLGSTLDDSVRESLGSAALDCQAMHARKCTAGEFARPSWCRRPQHVGDYTLLGSTLDDSVREHHWPTAAPLPVRACAHSSVRLLDLPGVRGPHHAAHRARRGGPLAATCLWPGLSCEEIFDAADCVHCLLEQGCVAHQQCACQRQAGYQS